jgi:hypothetical protein
MLIKHGTNAFDIQKEDDETEEEFNERTIFIIKNLNHPTYSIDDITDLSHVFKYKKTLYCSYSEDIEEKITSLSKNLFIDLSPL